MPFTTAELSELRANQRTFEAAYVRTALTQFSFALVVLRIFSVEFYSVGALFATYGLGIMLTSLLRRRQLNWQFLALPDEEGTHRKRFRTSGNIVVVLSLLTVAAHGVLLGLVMRL